MQHNRSWTVLFIGGASGTGKSSVAYPLARHYGVNILEIDDIAEALKALTTAQTLPALHYWDEGRDWMEAGIPTNVDWLLRVSREIAPALRAVTQDHIETGVPLVIEGDFLDPAFVASFRHPAVKAIFVHEAEAGQITQNYLAREGGSAQSFRAEISATYGQWLAGACEKLGIPLLASRPWDTVVQRAIDLLAP